MIQSAVWTDLAIQSLNETYDFVLKQWNKSISNEFLGSVDKAIDLLMTNPYLGLSIENTNFRRTLVNKHISLFYEISNDQLTILFIWDNRQDPDLLAEKIKK